MSVVWRGRISPGECARGQGTGGGRGRRLDSGSSSASILDAIHCAPYISQERQRGRGWIFGPPCPMHTIGARQKGAAQINPRKARAIPF